MLRKVGQTGSVCNLGTYELYEEILRLTKANGGCSINRKKEKPSSGYMVGIKGFGADLEEMLNYELEDNEYYGSWINVYSGEMEFDISLNVDSLERALELGRATNQISIYDLANDCSVFVE